MFDEFDFSDAMMLGTGYALLRHSQDRQAQQLIAALNQPTLPDDDHLLAQPSPEPDAPTVVNNLDHAVDLPEEWEDYIGQEPLKKQLAVAIGSAKIRKAPLPHTLLASGNPGVGKTTMARLIAKTLGVKMIEIVPPFKIETVVEAALKLNNKDVLFIDEIHKLSDGVGARGAEILLKILEDRVAYMSDGSVVRLPQITIIGATTDPDKLPETIIDRFKIKPFFQPYSMEELIRIVVDFAWRHRSEMFFNDSNGNLNHELLQAIAFACRRTPRIIEEMVLAVRDIALMNNQAPPAPEELLGYLEVEPDGLTRQHVRYLTTAFKVGRRVTARGDVEYLLGESTAQTMLRETKQGVARLERYLIEEGYLDRTTRGRRLTELGINRAGLLVQEGKG